MRILGHSEISEMYKTNYTLNILTLTIGGLLCLMFTSVNAQELPFSPNENHSPDYNPNIIYEQPVEQTDNNSYEMKPLEIQNRPTRSTVTKPKENTKTEKKEKATEEKKTSSGPTPTYENANNDGSESVLSFNFLFYMIQKFKFTDVVDQ